LAISPVEIHIKEYVMSIVNTKYETNLYMIISIFINDFNLF